MKIHMLLGGKKEKSLRVSSSDAKLLLKNIRKCVEEGEDSDGMTILSWSLDDDDNFRHGYPEGDVVDGNNWFKRGKLVPFVDGEQLYFKFQETADTEGPDDQGYLMGRFLSLLANHFSSEFAEATYYP